MLCQGFPYKLSDTVPPSGEILVRLEQFSILSFNIDVEHKAARLARQMSPPMMNIPEPVDDQTIIKRSA
jgi:hypothetical protein